MRVNIFKGKFESFDTGRIKRLRDQNDRFILNLNKKLSNELLAIAKRETPIRSGKARKSIKVTRSKNGFEIVPDVNYYEAIEFGRKAMVAKGDKVFAFKTDGKMIFTKRIKGTKGLFIFKELGGLMKQGGLTRRASNWAFKKSFD